jgi:hypothetical protein
MTNFKGDLMKFLTLFLTVLLVLTNFAHARSAMGTMALQSLRADLLVYGLEDAHSYLRLGEVNSTDSSGEIEVAEVATAYPEELTRPLSRYMGR